MGLESVNDDKMYIFHKAKMTRLQSVPVPLLPREQHNRR